MGNNSASQKKGTSPLRRPSAAEREELRARKREILECLDYANVPVEEQDATCKLLIDGGITNTQALIDANETILASLGVKPSVREILQQSREKLHTLSPNGKPNDAGNASSSTEPNGPSARRKKSIAAGGNLFDRNSRRDYINGKAALRTTKFVKGDIVEHYRESDNLIRKGRILAVHLDDLVNGIYYTLSLEGAEKGHELQSAETKLEFPGVWETALKEKGISPVYSGDAKAQTDPQQEAKTQPPTVESPSNSVVNDDDIL